VVSHDAHSARSPGRVLGWNIVAVDRQVADFKEIHRGTGERTGDGIDTLRCRRRIDKLERGKIDPAANDPLARLSLPPTTRQAVVITGSLKLTRAQVNAGVDRESV